MKKIVTTGLCLAAFILSGNSQIWNFIDPIKLEGTVNSEAEESTPIFGKGNSTLYFTRTFHKKNKGGINDQDVWVATRDENKSYTKAENLSTLNNKFNNAVVGISKSGDKLYLLNAYGGKKDQLKGIAVAEKDEKGKWGKPVKVDIPELDIDGDFYGFHVSEDEKTIIISYEGPNSLGQEDLYFSENKDGKWTKPLHMGNVINSSGFEMSPFLSPNKDTLFFSSDGFGGLGSADIFYSVRNNSWTDWSEPVNLGEPVNSPKFDAYYTYSGKFAYWSSNRDATEDSPYSNIYRSEIETPPLLTINCEGTDVTIYSGSDGEINLEVTDGVPPYQYAWSNGSTEQNPTGLQKGEYSVLVTDNLGQKAECDVFIDEPMQLQNIAFKHYFDYNSAELSTEKGPLKDFLTQVIELYNSGANEITILVNSSASKVTTRTFSNNQALAQTRADNLKTLLSDYLKEKELTDIEITINEVKVSGPDYTSGDFKNIEKYYPYQYVHLEIDTSHEMSEEVIKIESKDKMRTFQ